MMHPAVPVRGAVVSESLCATCNAAEVTQVLCCRCCGGRSARRPPLGAGHPAALHPGAGGCLHRQKQPHQAALSGRTGAADLLQMQRGVGAPERALLPGV